MSTQTDTALGILLDPTNPGQFFACCGLLEVADRIWNGAEGWFSETGGRFYLNPAKGQYREDVLDPVAALTACRLTNTMTEAQNERLTELSAMRKKDQDDAQKAEKKQLEGLRRGAPLLLQSSSFTLRLDWWHDTRAGGSRFKTWAGQQSVIDIATAMKLPLEQRLLQSVSPEDWLSTTGGAGLGFNFDAGATAQSAPLDMGFSLDPLGMSMPLCPLTELAAFIGLQRFRPDVDEAPRLSDILYRYTLWQDPLPPVAAAAAAAGIVGVASWQQYEFNLLFRTKYLKSFLTARPARRN